VQDIARLLLLLQTYHLGFEVDRYLSIEGLIEENKERYYETLEQSSQRWHEGGHDPWPYVNYSDQSGYSRRDGMSAGARRARNHEPATGAETRSRSRYFF
jgi:hypothetical protein